MMLFVQYVAAPGDDVLRVGSLFMRGFLDESVLFHHWTTFEHNDLKHLSGPRQVPDGDESQTKLAMRKLFSECGELKRSEGRWCHMECVSIRGGRRHPKLFGSAREQCGKA